MLYIPMIKTKPITPPVTPAITAVFIVPDAVAR